MSNFSASYPESRHDSEKLYPYTNGARKPTLRPNIPPVPDNDSMGPQKARIGIFDSGVGGLTVLRELYRQLPNESILYFGDTARLPYGNRTQAEILQFVREILTWMMRAGVKMAIAACNTSSALALKTATLEFNLPILGVILPAAAAVGPSRRIGVIATPATAASNAYRRAIQEIQPDARVWQVGCPEFVPLIEGDRIDDPYTLEVAREYLAPLLHQQIDTLVYGCTHYPLLEPVFKRILLPSVRLLNPAFHAIDAAVRELDLKGLRDTGPPLPTRFCVSGCPEEFAERSVQWLGFTPVVEKIHLGAVGESETFLELAY